MKKILLALLLITTSAILSAYSKPIQNTEMTLTGLVKVYGNEPVTFLGLKTDDGREFKIQADQNTLSELQNNQGYKIEITGIVEKPAKTKSQDQAISLDSLKDGKIIVAKWKSLGLQDEDIEDILEIHSIK
ncbi:MAG: hypothetical protein MR424_06890 [Treponema sp.]|nr:hypothetical protein [Treponema sp.]MCI6890555.1 hypothetical protein [Treponema sp.]